MARLVLVWEQIGINMVLKKSLKITLGYSPDGSFKIPVIEEIQIVVSETRISNAEILAVV